MEQINTSDLYDLFSKSHKVCIDSRKAEAGALFFALKGDNFDGNLYAAKALEKCAYAVVDDPSVVNGDNYILVEDALRMLQRLAAFHRKRLGVPIVAVTGTNGKTTTKELIAAVMSKKYNVSYTHGNLNNHIGVPLTLLNLNEDHDFAVVEMGANHVGEIKRLCKIAAPDFGIITNVGKAHLEGFGSFEGVKKAKAELYDYLYENDGLAFVNYDNEFLEEMRPPHSVIYYGKGGFTHYQGELIESDSNYISILWLHSDRPDVTHKTDDIINTKLVGEYNFENILAAIAIGRNFGVPKEDIISALKEYEPTNNRSQLMETGNNTVVMDGYNANPTSMRASIESFVKQKGVPKMVILGDMLELGNLSGPEHNVLIEKAIESGVEQCVFVGSCFYEFKSERAKFFKDVFELNEHLKSESIKGRTILIKGSRGIKLEEAVPHL